MNNQAFLEGMKLLTKAINREREKRNWEPLTEEQMIERAKTDESVTSLESGIL